jgi:hypothetical protein
MSKEILADDFLFSGLEANDETMSVFDKQTTNNDGIYRPNLKDATDKKIGYRATLRFLPNLLETGTIGQSAIEKHIHYVDMKNESNLSGYYDCRKNNEPNCELCTEYWKLKNSKNAADNEKAELIKRTTKYYSYVLVIEDDQHKELVGKILVYPYGFTIKEKINSERNGEVTGEPCNVFDLAKGKDFKLIIKEKGGFQNYEASSFLEVSPIKLFDDKTGKFRPAPVDEVGKISNAKVQAKIKEVLLAREVDINDHQAKEWDDATQNKVNQVLAILHGEDVYIAEQKSKTAKSDNSGGQSSKPSPIETNATDADDFFSLSDDEDDE